jgi:hypothetical protein
VKSRRLTAAFAVAKVIAIAALATPELTGCGSPPETAKAPSPPPSPAADAAPPDLASGALGEYRSNRFNLLLPLPDGQSWRIEDDRSPWLEGSHKPASAALLVRVWREPDIMNRARCESQARLSRGLPDRERAAIIEERRIDVPRGFDTVLQVGVLATARDEPITGFVTAFGGRVRRCFAYVLTTTASGKGAEERIAARLAAMVLLSLENITLEDDRAPAIPREPLP